MQEKKNLQPSPACQPLPCQVSGIHYNTSSTRSRRGYMGWWGGYIQKHRVGTVFSLMPLLGRRKFSFIASLHSGSKSGCRQFVVLHGCICCFSCLVIDAAGVELLEALVMVKPPEDGRLMFGLPRAIEGLMESCIRKKEMEAYLINSWKQNCSIKKKLKLQ